MALKTKFAFFILAFFAASSAEQSLIDSLTSNEFIGFAKLIQHAELSTELNVQFKKHEFITILFPKDNFLLNKVSPVLLSWLNMESNLPTLRQVLMNHIIIGRISLDKDNFHAKSISGDSLYINNVNGKPSVEDIPIDLSSAIYSKNVGVYPIDGLIMSENAKSQLSSFLSTVSHLKYHEKQHYGRHELSKLEFTSPTPSPSEDVPPPSAISPSPFSAPSPGPSSGASLAEIISILKKNKNYQMLLNYLSLIDPSVLESALSGNATILAPSDYAFGLLDPADLQLLSDTGRLADVILHHILSSYVNASGFEDGAGSNLTTVSKAETTNATYEYATLLEGYTLIVTVIDGKAYFGPNKATISQRNMFVDGQTSISGLDQVLIPPGFLVRASPSKSGSFMIGFSFLNTWILLSMILFFML